MTLSEMSENIESIETGGAKVVNSGSQSFTQRAPGGNFNATTRTITLNTPMSSNNYFIELSSRFVADSWSTSSGSVAYFASAEPYILSRNSTSFSFRTGGTKSSYSSQYNIAVGYKTIE